MQANQPIDPPIFIILGASGDLTWRMLVPALCNLYPDDRSPEKLSVLGVGLGDIAEDGFRDHLGDGVDRFPRRGKIDDDAWGRFAGKRHFTAANGTRSETYGKIRDRLDEQNRTCDVQANRSFYLALPTIMIEPVANGMGANHRGGDFDHPSVLRHMIRNRLLQILCLIAVEAPVIFEANAIRSKKVDVLHAIRRITREQVPPIPGPPPANAHDAEEQHR